MANCARSAGSRSPRDTRHDGHVDVAIEVRGLHKSYANTPAVVDLDLQIARGECFALLGPNGAGKTTTVEILEGFRRRDAGDIRVLGPRSRRTPTAPGGPGSASSARRSGRRSTSPSARQSGTSPSITPGPRPTDELLAAVGLTDKAGTRIPNLSGGQRRRLDVALGVQGHPELLFLDEPTTGLDPAARRQFWALIEGAAGGGDDDPAHDALPRRGRAPRRPGRRSSRPARCSRPPRRTTSVAALRLGGHRPLDRGRRRAGRSRPRRRPRPSARCSPRHPSGEIPGLAVHRPSLEDVYLAMLDGQPDEHA